MPHLRLAMRLAWRNLRRHLGRSAITALTIVIGIIMMLFTVSFSEGGYRTVVDTAARSGSGHVLVRPPDFDLLDPKPLDAPQAALTAIARIPGAIALPRTQALVLATGAGGAANVVAMGVDPAMESAVSILPEAMVAGEWLPTQPLRVPQALVGRPLAKRLDLELGDRMVLMLQRDGQVESRLTRIGGVFATNSEDVDNGLVLVRASAMADLLGDDQAVNSIAVVLDNLQRSSEVQRQLSAELPNTEVLRWDQAVPQIGDFISMDRAGADLSFVILFAIVSLAVLNAVLMSVFERSKEFGVMLAIGMQPQMLFTMVVLESALLSVASSAVGFVMGGALVLWFHHTGIDVSALMGGDSMDLGGYQFAGIIHPYLPLVRTVTMLVVVVLLTVVASLYPAWKASRIAPVEAIRDA